MLLTRHYLLLALLPLLCLLTACQTGKLPADFSKCGASPVLAVEYYPYPTYGDRAALPGVRPIPLYSGWTRMRMERDLQRMEDCGISVVLLTLKPENLADKEILHQFHSFLQQITKHQQLRFALSFCPNSPLKMQLSNIQGFLRHQGVLNHPAAWQPEGRQLLFINAKLQLEQDMDSWQLQILQMGKELPMPLNTWENRLVSEIRSEFQWLRVAEVGSLPPDRQQAKEPKLWTVPRAKGENLIQGLQQACRGQARYLLLSSWNNYRQGSFLEPNTEDGELMLNILQQFHALPPLP